MKTALSLPISPNDLGTIDSGELALRIIEYQRQEVGGAFCYCSRCGMPVSKRTASRAAKGKHPLMCQTCARATAGRPSRRPPRLPLRHLPRAFDGAPRYKGSRARQEGAVHDVRQPRVQVGDGAPTARVAEACAAAMRGVRRSGHTRIVCLGSESRRCRLLPAIRVPEGETIQAVRLEEGCGDRGR